MLPSFYPSILAKKERNAREKGKRTDKKNSDKITEFFDIISFCLRKVSLAFDVAVFFSDFLTENVLISRELNVLTIFLLEGSSELGDKLDWHYERG